VPTTITVSEKTRKRLASYKRGGSTFDDLLNRLMDAVDLEDFMEEDLAEHYRVLNDPNTEWLDGDEVIAYLKGERKTEPRVIRRGPREKVVSTGNPEARHEVPDGRARKPAKKTARRPRRNEN